jgi:hypothetical protein
MISEDAVEAEDAEESIKAAMSLRHLSGVATGG